MTSGEIFQKLTHWHRTTIPANWEAKAINILRKYKELIKLNKPTRTIKLGKKKIKHFTCGWGDGWVFKKQNSYSQKTGKF